MARGKTTNKSKKEEKGGWEQTILVAAIVVLVPILYVIFQNLSRSITVGGEIRALNREAVEYKNSIVKDSLLLEKIKTDQGLEEYARETFFMQRRGETVYIFEK